MPWRERPPYTRKPFRGRMVGSSNLPRPTTLPCLPPVFTRAGELAESAVSTAVLKVVKFRNRSRDSVPQEARGLVGTIRYRASFEGFQFSPFPILSNIIGLRTEAISTTFSGCERVFYSLLCLEPRGAMVHCNALAASFDASHGPDLIELGR